jgi:predicted lipoprotein with Yx(FWY)xxD motif
MVANNGTMNYLVDEMGNSLYYFTNDTKDTSNCDSACLEKWPVLAVAKPVAPSTIQGRFGSIAGVLTGTQSTFDGMPLYYFVGDKARGEMNGQGIKEVWYVVDPFAATQ